MYLLLMVVLPLLVYLCFRIVKVIMTHPKSNHILDFSPRSENVSEFDQDIRKARVGIKNRAHELERELKTKAKERKKAKDLLND